MLRAVASSPDRVVCVVGHAGAGKTTALAALTDAFQGDGYVAIGAAPSRGCRRESRRRNRHPQAAPSIGSSARRDSEAVSHDDACW